MVKVVKVLCCLYIHVRIYVLLAACQSSRDVTPGVKDVMVLVVIKLCEFARAWWVKSEWADIAI